MSSSSSSNDSRNNATTFPDYIGNKIYSRRKSKRSIPTIKKRRKNYQLPISEEFGKSSTPSTSSKMENVYKNLAPLSIFHQSLLESSYLSSGKY